MADVWFLTSFYHHHHYHHVVVNRPRPMHLLLIRWHVDHRWAFDVILRRAIEVPDANELPPSMEYL